MSKRIRVDFGITKKQIEDYNFNQGYNKALEEVEKMIDYYKKLIGSEWENYNANVILNNIKQQLKQLEKKE
jgi:hypothetical protein